MRQARAAPKVVVERESRGKISLRSPNSFLVLHRGMLSQCTRGRHEKGPKSPWSAHESIGVIVSIGQDGPAARESLRSPVSRVTCSASARAT